ncbi:MAG: HDOD domain-containing protein, partial [Armatimonadetes bacterium]|nr:HDOD domain-containing protein [Armatimonadota bacterium]
DRYMGEQYGQAVRLAREQQASLLETETTTLGLTHAWVSGWLARNWNLPSVLAESLLHHHQPESAAESARQVASVVNVANVVCHEVGLSGVEGVLPTDTPSAYGLGILGLEAGEATSIGPQVLAETAALEKQLSGLGG